MFLYHSTSRTKALSILKKGMNAGSYWTNNPAIAEYYAETVSDENEEPMILTTELKYLKPGSCAPDNPGIEEPIATVLGISEEEIHKEWENMQGTWRDSLNLVGSIKYLARIPAIHISVIK